MKQKLMFPMAILALCFCFAGIAAADSHSRAFKGDVVMVDPALRIFIIRSKNVERTFHLDNRSTVTIGGEIAPLSELRRGYEVTVTVKNPDPAGRAQIGGQH